AWDTLFQHFNGDGGYQSGEKIVIKVNLNNCWQNPYGEEDNDADANPYLVKELLDQLVNVVGVDEENITVYDAVRTMANWFYNPLASDFPDVNYVDYRGGASGRQKVTSSGIKIYFTNEMDRTLPLCVTQAKYLINMPIMKRHTLGSGVTLAGKNHFGSFMTSPSGLHTYHLSAFTEGNPAPQTDIHAHEHIGGKTLLYIADGLYGSPVNHVSFGHFDMYPFNDDWANSLFFSQDGVAIDSVMWDFLNVEGDPAEGSQNYLHQSADPPADVYDPEGDGTYLNESLGVHEHWNTTIDIFSSDRYSGPAGDGIDYIAVGEVDLEADANGPYNGVVNISIQFYGNASGGTTPYTWYWEFGDGNTSTEQNPPYTYSTTGNYTATLTVTDDYNATANDTASVHVEPELEADANGPYDGTICEPIEFSGSASGGASPYKWYWRFGDGGTSTQQYPSHQYDDTGNYTVKLTVTDDWGYTDDDVTWAIVTCNELEADANGPYEGYYVGADVKFNGSATGGCEPYSWLWDFGDGKKSDEEDPTHQYMDAGNYTVTLTVTDDVGYIDDDVTWANISDLVPDLECEGTLSWSKVKPGETVSGSFTVKNIGDNGSLLDWKITKWSLWGSNWAFTPRGGDDLKPSDGSVTVNVSVKAPNEKNKEFTGEVKIVNKENTSDNCTIPVYLKTPKNKSSNFNFNLLEWLFERFPNTFPILRYMLGL
ncbi:MAG: PKD domain-containing protein, partial [Thermoplasmatales archaeon]